MRIRVGVIFGGRSGEHEVSVRSAAAVIENIDKEKYEPVPIAITHAGAWLSPRASIGLLPERVHDAFAVEATDGEFALIGDTSYNGLTALHQGTQNVGIDVAFPVLHGTFGEDGTIQGLLEMAGLPYVGCGVLASSCGMDKVVMKSLFHKAGLPQCRYSWLLRRDFEADADSVIGRVESEIGYPAFVKPANLGSSVGVSRAESSDEIRKAIDEAAKFDRKIIVEEALKMREIECGVIGNDIPTASRPGEYVIRDKSKAFLDYTEKYAGTGNNEFVVPAGVSGELEAKIMEMSIAAFKAIDGSGLARVDFFLRTDNGMLLINEINTMPGLTDASGFPKMWAGSGVSFTEVIDQLISLAIERQADRSRNLTSL
ncbi:MAG: D-alanine--D-alanine ligase [Acidobacteria bacterium]|nr:D-alanine--D-alanine ligase [Acidobacteriota bacterium]